MVNFTMIPGISYNQLLNDIKQLREYLINLNIDPRGYTLGLQCRIHFSDIEELIEQTKYCEDINK